MTERKPEWLKIKIKTKNVSKVDNILKALHLNTVCHEAKCPNRNECFSNKTATFMIMGDKCTRNCLYCSVKTGKPTILDKEEPKNIAKAVKELGLKHAVITSVTRDDLADKGANHFKECITEIRNISKDTTIEVLIPDFINNLETVIDVKPDVLNHNIEACKNIFKKVRPGGNYDLSLELLKKSKQLNPDVFTKSGFMVGLGESFDEVVETLKDLRKVDTDFVTIGQYLRPTKDNLPVYEYVTLETFKEYEKIAYELGFKHVASGPFVRSSYDAKQALKEKR